MSDEFDPSKPFTVLKKSEEFDPSKPFKVLKQSGPSQLESGIRGAAQSASFGFADEATGALEAGKDLIMDPQTNLDNVTDKYSQHRDESRKNYHDAEKANPGSYLTGELAGGAATMAVPGLNAMKAATFAGRVGAGALAGARVGAISGLGASEGQDASEVIRDTGKGAAIGGAFGGAVPAVLTGAGKAIQPVQKMVQDGPRVIKDFKGSFGSGFQEGAQQAQNIPVVSSLPLVRSAAELVGGIKGGIQAGRNAGILQNELKTLSVNNGKTLSVNNGKDLSAPIEDLGIDLLNAGPSPTKDWVASRAATVAPGQIKSDQYRQILEMGTDRQRAATKFDAKAISGELSNDFDTVAELLGNDRAKTFQSLHTKAAAEFKPEVGDKALSAVQRARNSANGLKSLVGGRTSAVLEDVNEVLTAGKAPDGYSVLEGAWETAAGPERFHRLQLARQAVDKELKFSKESKSDFGEKILSSARDAIDDALKSSPSKRQADALYSQAKQIEAKLSSATEFRNPAGRTEVDAVKVEKLLGNSDNARRFQDTQKEILDFVQQPGVDPETKQSVEAVLKRFKAHSDTAADRRIIQELRSSQGPSSPVIERQNHLINKSGLPPAAINSPSGYINSVNDFIDTMGVQVFNKPWEQLALPQKSKIMRAYKWRQENPLALQTEEQKKFSEIFGGR